jgi:metal-responsive CopG/Arc/MetJ family transcriptional regulator
MRVTISIPDSVFRAAERASRRMRIPRSQLYARAVAAFVAQTSGDAKRLSGEEITRRLNEVYSKGSSKLDPAWEAASLEVLRRRKR